MHDSSSTSTPEDLIEIFATLDTSRVRELFTGRALVGLHELLVEAMQCKNWLGKGLYDERANFLQSLRPFTKDVDDYRRLFMVMVEAGHAQGVLGMLHATGRKERVMLGHQPLITMGTLTGLVKYAPEAIQPVIHFLTKASISMLPEEPASLFKALIKAYDPNMNFSGRWLEAIQGLSRTRSLAALGMKGVQQTPSFWLTTLVTSKVAGQTKVAAAVVAGLMAKGEIEKEQLQKIPFEDGHKLRLIKELGLNPEIFNVRHVASSREKTVMPSYRL
jgi:hypothetical protein